MKKLELTPSRNVNYRRGQVAEGDRYVGVRSDEQLEMANHLLKNEEDASTATDSPATRLERETKRLTMRINPDKENEDKVCAFRKGLAPLADMGHRQSSANIIYSCVKPSSSVKRSRRYIAKSPERILDAPGIRDDFYASLVDWSLSNMVAVALEKQVYIWDAEKGDAELLTDFKHNEAHPTLVKFSQEGKYLCVGLNNGFIKIYDVLKRTCLRTISAQTQRIACGSWTKKGILSYGARSGRIYHHDVRVQNSLIGTFEEHTHEVCGLKWSDDERFLTSGGADCVVNVWDHSQVNSTEPHTLWSFNDHTAAVKAIEYVPFLGMGGSMVATGGGTNDHHVRVWNLTNGTSHMQLDTFSQVSGILFNKTFKEMITGHGNPNSGVRVWRHNAIKGNFEHLADLKSHGGRVLGLCHNPDNSYVMSIGEDEAMRIWCCWKVDASIQQQQNALLNNVGSSSSRKKLDLLGLKGLTIR